MRHLAQDLKYGARQLRRSPGFTIVAVLTLALGIGATTAFSALVEALLERPAPGVTLDGAHVVRSWPRTGRRDLAIPPDAARGLEPAPPGSVEAAGAAFGSEANVLTPGRIDRIAVEGVTPGYARVFRLSPSRGRWIEPGDDLRGAPRRVAVISDHLWREIFHGDPAAVGTATIRVRPIVTNGAATEPFTVVGVGPAGYRGQRAGIAGAIDLWIPLGALFEIDQFASQAIGRIGVAVFARPRAGIDADAVAPQVHAILASASAAPPDAVRATLTPASVLFGPPPQWSRSASMVVALSVLVLIAACANLANMLYARGVHRAGEIAVRLSLGASRSRIVRLLFVEAALIALMASLAGLAVSAGGVYLFAQALPGLTVDTMRLQTPDFSPSLRVFATALGAGAVSALLVGGLTAWRSTRVPPVSAFAASGAAAGLTMRGRGLRTVMVAVQVTAAVVLVMTCGLYLETTVTRLIDRELIGRGIRYDSDRVVAARVDLRQHGLTESRGRHFFDRLLAHVAAIDGVEAVSLGDGLPGGLAPLAPGEMYLMVEDPPEGAAGDGRRGVTRYARVSPGYLKTLGVPLTRGRDFVETDAPGATPVAIVSEGAARTMWPGQDPIGRRLRFDRDYLTVVGVSADPIAASERWRFDLRTPNFVYLPFAQHYQASMAVVVRSDSPLAQVDALRAAVAAVDPDVAVLGAATLESTVLAWWAPARAALFLIGSLAAASLAIAMLGVYGVLQFFVSTRTREFGIRTALGATPRRVIRLVLDEAVHIVLVGLLFGVLAAALGSRVIEYRQFGIMPNSITNWVVVPLLILGAGLLAGYLPARRAARVDPNVALRSL